MNSALILIDIQNEYFKGGKRELHLPEQAAARAAQALVFCRSKGLPVYHVRHINAEQGSTSFVSGSAGAEIHESVKPFAGEAVIIKHYPSAFLKTGLSEELLGKGISHLIICGMMSHMCVDTTVRAAQDYGFSVTLLEDACTTRDLLWGGETIPAETVHNAFMAALNGTFAKIVKTEEFLVENENS
jgi:nicotinamidase-related amidase